jgi:hypothetical protein
MYKGEPSKGLEFYNLLIESEEFTSELGKVALASGRLEAELILFMTRNKVKGSLKKSSLGQLISLAASHKLFSDNEITTFKRLNMQRNYITHNIYSLFINLIDETILEKENLLDSDVHLYIERASILAENLNGSADFVKNKKIVLVV